ncbi:MAG: AraC family transcriptional regulator [Paenibacillus sp.]|nr:AraC family transcriptional regulator [Paenibacillus sp.]
MKLRLPKPNTLYGQLLLSFICIILLFSLMNGLLFSFFQSRLAKEAVASRHDMLEDVSTRYEEHLAHLKTMLNNVYNDATVREFNRQLRAYGPDEANYLSAYRISNALRTNAYNPLFYLEGIIVHYGIGDFAVDQDGSSSASDMFGRAYASPVYSHAFWEEQLRKDSSVAMLPANHYASSSDVTDGASLMPISFKLPGEEYQVIALLNADKALAAFAGEAGAGAFVIADENGRLLYKHGLEEADAALPEFPPGASHVLIGDTYWFKTATEDGTAYYSAVSHDAALSGLRHWFWWSAAVFACALVLATAVSFYFSLRIKRPVDRLLDAASGASVRLAPDSPDSHGIREYAAIESRIRQLMAEKETVQSRMNRHRSILTSYGYMSQIKNINEDLEEWQELMASETEGSYDLILYELNFRAEAMARLNLRPEQAALAIREHIREAASGLCPGSHTFQLEHNHILTVVRNGRSETVAALVAEAKRLLDPSASHCLVTIAVSARFEHAAQFGHAYDQARSWIDQAQPLNETQIITAPRELPDTPRLSAEDIERLSISLQAGQAGAAVQAVDGLLAQLHRSGAAVRQYAEAAGLLAELLTGELRHADEPDPHIGWTLRSIRRGLSACHTIEEYRAQLVRLAETVALALSMTNVSDDDPVVSRVMGMLETNFGGDISLEQIAHELNMSAAYLSTYIKDKSGTNFIDHLNGLRMAKAKELLSVTSRRVGDIAREVGYENVTSFNRLFKKSTGVSPSEYRRGRQETGKADRTG